MVTVKMITYNHAPYVAQAIEGVLAQVTTFPVMLVIGDDCSTDSTPEIIRRYASLYPDRIKAVLRPSNVGMVENFFSLDELVQGKYLAFCEGDDYWDDPYKLQKQVDILEGNASFGLVYTNVRQLVQGIGFKREVIRSSYPEGNVLEELLNGAFISTVTVLVRCSAYFEAASSVKDKVLEYKLRMIDYPLWIEIASRHMVAHVNDYCAVYRILGESASHSVNPDRQISFHQSVIDVVTIYANELRMLDRVEQGVATKRLTMYRLALISKSISLPTHRRQFLECGLASGKAKLYRMLASNRLLEWVLGSILRRVSRAS